MVNQIISTQLTGPLRAGRSRYRLLHLLCSLILTATLIVPFASVSAHTPYGQWDSFRLRHLQLLTTRTDLTGDAFADTWVAVLAEHLPKAKAVVSRARNFARLASLLKTDQAKLAVLSHDHASAMYYGTAPFEDFGPIPIQVLLDNGTHLLITREDLPVDHGFLLVATLLEQATELNITVPEDSQFEMAVHAGAIAAVAGELIEQKH